MEAQVVSYTAYSSVIDFVRDGGGQPVIGYLFPQLNNLFIYKVDQTWSARLCATTESFNQLGTVYP